MKRRIFLGALAGAGMYGLAGAAATDWESSFGYPTGWGPSPREMTNKTYRIGNYSGGFESMFKVRPIAAAAGNTSPLTAASTATASGFAPVAARAATYMKNWPVTGLFIARKGTVLFEQYQFNRTAEMRMTSWSMAKSVTSLLLGICVDRGLVRSMDDTAETYVDELRGTLHGGTTLRNLANMSSGAAIVHDRDNQNIYPRALTTGGSDLEAVVREWNNRAEEQGERYNYNELCPLTIGMVIRKVTGMPMADFCSEALWKPMGAEADATWMTDSKGKEFNCIGIGARVRDWARLGQLVAQDGVMQSKQVVSAQWIRDCTSWSDKDAQVRHGTAMRNGGYKYLFWHGQADGNRVSMVGHHGQRVVIDRVTQTVLVQTAVDQEGPWQAALLDVFLAACAQKLDV